MVYYISHSLLIVGSWFPLEWTYVFSCLLMSFRFFSGTAAVQDRTVRTAPTAAGGGFTAAVSIHTQGGTTCARTTTTRARRSFTRAATATTTAAACGWVTTTTTTTTTTSSTGEKVTSSVSLCGGSGVCVTVCVTVRQTLNGHPERRGVMWKPILVTLSWQFSHLYRCVSLPPTPSPPGNRSKQDLDRNCGLYKRCCRRFAT